MKTTKCQNCHEAEATREMLGVREGMAALFCHTCADRLQAMAAAGGHVVAHVPLPPAAEPRIESVRELVQALSVQPPMTSDGFSFTPGAPRSPALPSSPEGDTPMTMSNETADELLADIQAHDGREIHRDDWPLAEQLRVRGLITLGSARGPGNNWRHATLTPDHRGCSTGPRGSAGEDDVITYAAKVLVLRAAKIESEASRLGRDQQLARARLESWREAAQVLIHEIRLCSVRAPADPCCEGARRVEVVPGDATTLAGWSCPDHGVR